VLTGKNYAFVNYDVQWQVQGVTWTTTPK